MAEGKAVQAARIIRDRLAGRCPVTGGCVTRMTRRSFLRVCGRQQEQARKNVGKAGWVRRGAEQYCLECQGKHLPQELEIIDVEANMPSKKAEGKCDCCGKTKRVKKVHGYMACSICEHLVRAVKNSPELVRRLWGDAHGAEIGGNEDDLAEGIRQALKVPDDVASGELPGMVGDLMLERGQYAAELNKVHKALEAAGDDDLVEVAGRRMADLHKLEHERNAYAGMIVDTACMLGEDASWSGVLPDLAREVIGNIQRAAGVDADIVSEDLYMAIKELREGKPAVLEEKSAPADHVSVSRLLSDRDLLASINTLSDALRN